MEPLRRLWGLVVSPAATLARVATEPTFALPLLLLVAALGLRAAVSAPRIDVRDTVERELRGENPEALSSEIDRAVEVAARAQVVLAYAGSLAGPLLRAFGASLLLLLMGRFLGARPAFGSCFGSGAHALVPSAFAALASIPPILSRERIGPDELDRLLPSNLAAAFPMVGGVLGRVLGALDFFAAWQVALLALALAAVSDISWRRTAPAMLVLWASWIAAVHVGLGGAGGGGR